MLNLIQYINITNTQRPYPYLCCSVITPYNINATNFKGCKFSPKLWTSTHWTQFKTTPKTSLIKLALSLYSINVILNYCFNFMLIYAHYMCILYV